MPGIRRGTGFARTATTWCRALVIITGLSAWATMADAASLEIRYEAGEVGPFEPGDTVTVGIWMADLPSAAAGFQAFLAFDASAMTFLAGGYTPAPFGQPIIDPIVAIGNEIDLAAGIDFESGQPPSGLDARLATLTFLVDETFCVPPIDFRATDPPSRLSDPLGSPIVPLQLVAFPDPPCPADLDGNGVVGFSDLLIVLAAWGEPCPGDIDGDGEVRFDDLIIVLADWGPC